MKQISLPFVFRNNKLLKTSVQEPCQLLKNVYLYFNYGTSYYASIISVVYSASKYRDAFLLPQALVCHVLISVCKINIVNTVKIKHTDSVCIDREYIQYNVPLSGQIKLLRLDLVLSLILGQFNMFIVNLYPHL